MRAEAIIAALKKSSGYFQKIDETEFENQERVVAAFRIIAYRQGILRRHTAMATTCRRDTFRAYC